MSLAETAAGIDGAFTVIPVIDLSKCDTPEGRLATAHEIRDACVKVGFFYIQNHSVPQTCLDKVFDAVQTFFSLPMEKKMKLYHKVLDNNSKFKGYSPPLDSNIDPTNNDKADFYESFEVGCEEVEAKEYEKTMSNDGATSMNVWPSEDYPEFRESFLEYYHAALNVGKMLFPLFALALNLPETYFDDKTRNSPPFLKALHYPLQDGHAEINENTPGIGAHSDFECFTILWQQPGIQALQVMNSEKQWIDVPPIRDTMVINIGDQFAIWTNDVFKSTVHRAINKSGLDRYSIPLFFGTDYHVMIEPMPSCVSASRPAKYEPIAAGEYVNKRLEDMYHKA